MEKDNNVSKKDIEIKKDIKKEVKEKKSIISKLFTKEDTFHIHKLFGFLVLFHFVYQVTYYIFTGTMNIKWYYMLPHVGLHLSSLKFKVLSQRPSKMRGNMFIWQELRLHAAVFAMRAVFAIWYPMYGKIIIFVTMLLADLVTHLYGNPEVSTVRGNHNYVKKSMIKKVSGAFFSISQLGGTLICSGCFQPNGVSKILAFCTLPAIQTSAFGMTLLRKNIISKETWQIVYSIELILTYWIWFTEYRNLWLLPIGMIAYFLRTQNISKYLVWLLFVSLDTIL